MLADQERDAATRGLSNRELADSGYLVADRLHENENYTASKVVRELARRVDPNPTTDQ